MKATTSEQLGFTGRSEGIARWRPPRCACRGPGDELMADRETREPRRAPCSISARRKKLMVATAESCTGGLVAGALTDIAGSSDVVDRGFVTYTNEAKQQMLGVPADTLEQSRRGEPRDRRGDGARRARPCAMPISRSRSPASPGRAAASAEKPVGLVHFAAASRSGALIHRERRFGDIGRAEVRRRSVLEALAMLGALAETDEPDAPQSTMPG